MQAATTAALHTLMFSVQPFPKEGDSSSYKKLPMQMRGVGTNSFHEHVDLSSYA